MILSWILMTSALNIVVGTFPDQMFSNSSGF